MSVHTVPERFVVDGVEFDRRSDAEAFAAVREAIDEYEKAGGRLCRALADQLRTADGKSFELSGMRDYWRIAEIAAGDYLVPYLARVTLPIRPRLSVDFESENAVLEIEATYADKRRINLRPSSLYVDKGAAELDYAMALRSYVDKAQRRIADLEGGAKR
ncbi:MAG: hypothetical protein AAFX50_17415 [Acidobacteriota bacterium]